MYLVYKKDGFFVKVIACLFVAMFIVMCLYGSKVFATDITALDGSTVSLPNYDNLFEEYQSKFPDDEISILITRYQWDNRPYLLTFSKVIKNSDPVSCFPRCFSNSSGYKYFTKFTKVYELKNDSWVLKYDFSSDSSSTSSDTDNIYFTNVDLKDNDGNVVFSPPPQQEEETTTTILPPIATSMDFSVLMQEILTILPTILLVVISAIALRKAIKLLFSILIKS